MAAQPVPEPAAASIPFDPEVRQGTLPNGMRYYIRKNGKPERYAEFRLALNAGSLQEADDQQGLAHFVEHMCFNGTANFPKSALVDYLESIGTRFGAHLNAYTSFDETVYMLRIPTDDPQKFRTGLQILEDWAHNVSFEGEEIEKERGVVIEEWRTRLGAANRMNQRILPKTFYQSRYADRLPIGQREILETFPHETLRQFYRDWYRPDLMAIIAVGDFNQDSVERMIVSQFSQIPAASSPKPREIAPVPDHSETLIAIESDEETPNSQIRITYKHPLKPLLSVSDYRRDLLETLAADMLNARLSELSQQADAPFNLALAGTGTLGRVKAAFNSLAIVPPGGHLKGLQALLVENERASRFGFTQSELDRARKTLLTRAEQSYNEREKTESRTLAMAYVAHFLSQKPVPGIGNELKLYQELLPGISLDEVNAAVKDLIHPENRLIICTGPRKDGVVMPTEAEVRQTIGQVQAMQLEPYQDQAADQPLMASMPKPGELLSESRIDALDVTELRYANGVRVILKPTDFQNDEIQLTAFSPGGHSLYPDDQALSASYAAAIVSSSGVGPYNNVQLEKYLSDKSAEAYPYISELQEGFNGASSIKDFEIMLQLIHLYCTQPRKDPDAFASFMAREKALAGNALSNPENWFRKEVNTVMTGGHPRKQLFPQPEELGRVNLETAYEVFRDRFADAGDFTFVLVGSFDPAAVKPLLAAYLGSLPGNRRTESWRDIGVMPPDSALKQIFRKGKEPKSVVSMQYHGSFEWTPENRFNLNAALQVLNIMMRESMREDQGGVYGVQSGVSTVRDPKPRYTVNIGFVCAPENAERLIGTAVREAETLANEGPSEKNLQKVKELLRKDLEVGMKENRWWMSQLNSAYQYGTDPARLLQSAERIEAISAADIQSAAKQHLKAASLAAFVLLPEITDRDR